MNRPLLLTIVSYFIALAADLDAATFVDLGDLNVTAVSSDGRYVVGNTPNTQAFRWSRETGLQTLEPLWGGDGYAEDVSGDGSIVVGDDARAFRWTEETGVIALTPIGYSYALAISDDGTTIVGGMQNGGGSRNNRAFRWTADDGTVDLGLPDWLETAWANGVSADGSIVVGSGAADGQYHPFVWSEPNGFQDLGPVPDDWPGIRPNAVSPDGSTVLGVGFDIEGKRHPFRWTREEGIQPLPEIPDVTVTGRLSAPLATTTDGSVIVGAFDRTPEPGDGVAFVWDKWNSTRDLREGLIREHGFTDEELPSLGQARDITPDGKTIIGDAVDFTPWVIYLDRSLTSTWGDLNDDHYRNAADIDLLSRQILAANPSPEFDLNNDGQVDASDHEFWVHEITDTYFGDANLDGQFDAGDFVSVFEAGQYEDHVAGNSGWATGDWNGDAEFSTDLVLAFQDGGYEQGPRVANAAVPEPASCATALAAVFTLLLAHRAAKRRGVR